jgi:hypothetical protein
MLHPFRRQIEQLKPLLIEILNHAVLFRPGEARVKRSRFDVSLPQACHLILHECIGESQVNLQELLQN